MKENYKKFQCQKCDFALWKIVAGRQMEISEVEELISKRVVGPLQGFRSKMGRPFAAVIKLSPEFKPEFDFGQNQTNADGTAVGMDFSGQEPLGKCPKCGGKVFDTEAGYICEKSQVDAKPCRFKISREILQQPIEPEQARTILKTGKSDLLDKFISKAGKPFPAFLVMDKKGKVTFEFPERD